MFVEGERELIIRTPRFEEAALNMFRGTPSTSTRRDWHNVHACQTAVLQGAH